MKNGKSRKDRRTMVQKHAAEWDRLAQEGLVKPRTERDNDWLQGKSLEKELRHLSISSEDKG